MRSFLIGTAALLACLGSSHAQTPVARGDYLVNTIMSCGNCHTPKGPKGPVTARALSGGLTFDTPAFKATASNITPDRETGIDNWSDADIKRAITDGVRPNGSHLASVMPSAFYKGMRPGDLDAIVAYLRTVKPINNKVPAPIYKLDAPHAPYPLAQQPTASDLKDKVKRGLYLATIGHCMECHTPRIKGRQDFANDLGKGGNAFPGPWGKSVSENITSHKSKGLGAWSDAEIKRAITQGVSRDGRKLKPPMDFPAYSRMTDADLDAVIAWLRTVPPKE